MTVNIYLNNRRSPETALSTTIHEKGNMEQNINNRITKSTNYMKPRQILVEHIKVKLYKKLKE